MASLTYGSASAPAYRTSGALTSAQRMAAWSGVIGLHAAVIVGLAMANLSTVQPEPEPTLMVSFVSQNPSPSPTVTPLQPQPPSPQPPQPQQQVAPPTPQPPTPAPKLIASSRSTAAVSAAPPEAPPVEARPQPAAPAPAPAPAAVAAASEASGPVGPVTPPDFTAAYLRNPPPVYPESSRRKKEEGIVKLRVRVGADGSPDQVTIHSSSGFPDLDRAALDVVQNRWKFVPAKQAGRAIAGVAIIPMPFRLNKR